MPFVRHPLFIAGCPRSGTSAFADYLNDHPEVLVAIERYNRLKEITSDLFARERLLDFRPEDTGQPRGYVEDLVRRKRWESLRWVGDKRPTYFFHYAGVAARNPGARFVYVYRPLEAVAESFQEKRERPGGWALTVEDAVRLWNAGIRRTRRFALSGAAPLLVVDYDGFFSDPEGWATVLSAFLGVAFGPGIVEGWKERTARHDEERRAKRPLAREQQPILRLRDAAAEEWIVRCIGEQMRQSVTR